MIKEEMFIETILCGEKNMNSIHDIERAILQLPQPDLRVLRGWFDALEVDITTMIPFRQIQEIHAGIVTVTVPTNFPATRAEVIIVPIEDVTDRSQHLQQVLLNAPTLPEEELQPFFDVREWMNQWNVDTF